MNFVIIIRVTDQSLTYVQNLLRVATRKISSKDPRDKLIFFF